MINEDLILDGFIEVEANSNWSKNTLSREQIDALSVEELREYVFDISCRFTSFGYDISRICEAVKTLRKYQH